MVEHDTVDRLVQDVFLGVPARSLGLEALDDDAVDLLGRKLLELHISENVRLKLELVDTERIDTRVVLQDASKEAVREVEGTEPEAVGHEVLELTEKVMWDVAIVAAVIDGHTGLRAGCGLHSEPRAEEGNALLQVGEVAGEGLQARVRLSFDYWWQHVVQDAAVNLLKLWAHYGHALDRKRTVAEEAVYVAKQLVVALAFLA